MSKTKVNAKLRDKMAFVMDLNGHKFITDASETVGGSDLGPRPKVLLLAGLIGCTGMDVISMLKKMRVELDDFDLEVETDSSDEHPKVYQDIHVKYIFTGKDLPMDKLEKAVNLSQERYCGVSAMLKKATDITYEIIVKEE